MLVLTAPATAARVGWSETLKFKGVKMMTYTVDTLTFDSSGWRARVSFRNTSAHTVKVRSGFGVGLYGDARTTSLRHGEFVPAMTFSKKLPKSLRPGGSWTGTIGSPGRLATPDRVYARVVFGPFSGLPGTTSAIVWITDHARALGNGSGAQVVPVPFPGPPVI